MDKRVYVTKSGDFGTIVRSGGILGIKDSFAIVDDVGNRTFHTGKCDDFAYSTSGETPSGKVVDIPLDGIFMIKEHGQSSTLEQEYTKMSREQKDVFCESWSSMTSEERTNAIEEKRPTTRRSKRLSQT